MAAFMVLMAGFMRNDVRIKPETKSDNGQAITFVVAIGSIRQSCCLRTSHPTQSQALAYLRKHRTIYEQMAQACLRRGEVEDGMVHLKMLG
jgi:hypothetical protein